MIRAAVLSLLIVSGGLAQPAPTPKKGPPRALKDPAATAAVPLATEPFRMDSVGLSVRFPEGCKIDSTRVGGRLTATVRSPDDFWVMNIQTPVAEKDSPGIKQALDKTIALVQGSYGVVDPDQKEILETQAKILERADELTLPGGPAARVYLSVPRGDKTRLIKGYTIFKPAATQFVIFELICGEADFARQRPVYETIVGTALFQNADALVLARATAAKSGAAFLKGLTESDYTAAMGDKELWYRWYTPGAKSVAEVDATELGYRGVRFWRGQRGETNPTKPKANWTKAEAQDGFLAQVRARVLIDKACVDTVAIYFMTPDRVDENWSITTTVKDAGGEVASSASEIGARHGDDMVVQSTATGRPTVTMKPPVVTDAYITQFETALLPRLIVHKGLKTDLGFYAFQRSPDGNTGTVQFRKDALSGDGPVFTLTTWFREDAGPQLATYSEKGDLLRIVTERGDVWEPMELSSLRRIWQTKGLPTDR